MILLLNLIVSLMFVMAQISLFNMTLAFPECELIYT